MWQQVWLPGVDKRTVLAITDDRRLMNDLRVLAIENAWNIRFAANLRQALARQPSEGNCVALYDRNTGGVLDAVRGALDAVRLFARSESPVLTIVLSGRADAPIRNVVMHCGGFDAATSAGIAHAVNSALALVCEIDSCEHPVHV